MTLGGPGQNDERRPWRMRQPRRPPRSHALNFRNVIEMLVRYHASS
jgi:hypothetical protein